MPRRHLSIRSRTTLLAASVAGLALLLGAWSLLFTLDRTLTHSGDGLAISRARDLASLAKSGHLPAVLANITGESVAQVVGASGEVLAASPNVTGRPAISDFRPEGSSPVLATIDGAPDDDETENYRVWVLSTQAPYGQVTIYVGDSLESVSEATTIVRRTLTVGLPLLLLVLAWLTWVVIGRALRPVERIRSEVANISATDLDRRISVPPADDEIGRLAATMNEMLGRLELASRRQRDFVADASHELQSPLAAFRAQLEVALTHPAGVDWPAVAHDVLEDSGQMEKLVSDLLFLAREQDPGTRDLETLVDLDDLVLQEAARARLVSTCTVDTSRVSAAPVRGSVDELRRLVRNLLENAVKYARSKVELSLSCDDTRVRLDVADDGPGVPTDQFERVFDRFYQGDGSRSRDRGGTGLGLAIARTIAERHSGSVGMTAAAIGAHVVVLLPAHPSTPTD